MPSDGQSSDASPFFESIVERLREQNPEAPAAALRLQARQMMEEWRSGMSQPLEREDLTSGTHLQDLQDSGVWGVKVLSERDDQVCEACREADGTIYPIEDALETKPLPHPACTNDECRCVYLPVKHKPWEWEG